MAKKRANGEGSIRKRKDGRWEGRYTAGHDPATGKTIYKNVLGKTQGEVKDIPSKFRGRLPSGLGNHCGTEHGATLFLRRGRRTPNGTARRAEEG